MIKLPESEIYRDYRGALRVTHFDKRGVPFRPCQSLVVYNHAGVFRGFHHQQYLGLRKAVYCLEGTIHDFALNTKTGAIQGAILTPATNGVLIEAKEAHGYYSPGQSVVLYYYDVPYRPEWQQGYDARGFLGTLGIRATLSEQDQGWPEWQPQESPSSSEPLKESTEK